MPAVDKLREEIDAFERKRKSELDAPPTVGRVAGSRSMTLEKFADRTDATVTAAEAALKLLAKQTWRSRCRRRRRSRPSRAKNAYGQQQKDKPTELRELLANYSGRSLKRQRESLAEDGPREGVAGCRGRLDARPRGRSSMELDREPNRKRGSTRCTASRSDRSKKKRCCRSPRRTGSTCRTRRGLVTDAWRKVARSPRTPCKSDVNRATRRKSRDRAGRSRTRSPSAPPAAASRAGLQFDGPLNRRVGAERSTA